ncbi:alpha/beta hydrolase [Gemmatimonas sp.]|uniref:alpha/beta hydrolase n=1 Tax=Gemmatimonas sp. TaxID=1962908 RepID=UPI00286B97F9|nr:alpha/beta hydrolase [Gemmatimonas sp.]
MLSLVDRVAPGQQVTLVGHSWGGMYGTSVINRHAEQAREAVQIETGPTRGSTFERIKDELYDVNPLREWLNDVLWSTQWPVRRI